MGTKLQPDQMELYRRVDEILTYLWDPIGLAGNPHTRDEYRSYLPQVFRLLQDSASEDDMTDYLYMLETSDMGLGGTTSSKENALRIAGLLLDAKKYFEEKCDSA